MRKNVIPVKQLIDSIYTHDLERLIAVAELRDDLTRDRNANEELDANWSAAVAWNEESRYRRWSKSEAMDLYEAIADERNGVLQWIVQRW
jgi:hypothetical protein